MRELGALENECTAGSFDQRYDPDSIACRIDAWRWEVEGVEMSDLRRLIGEQGAVTSPDLER